MLLLSSPAKRESVWARALRYASIAVGILAVVVGLADVSTRILAAAGGEHALFDAFAPAAALPQKSVAPKAVAGPRANQVGVGTSTTPAGAIVPARLKVPALGIDAAVQEVGRRADGSMGTPSDFMEVGFWGEGALPGAKEGSAVFDGHVNNALTKAGVFEHLGQIKKGDYVTVSDAEGHTLVYRVEEIQVYEPDQAPRASIFAKAGAPKLVLITCDGEWEAAERQFTKRLVIVALPA